MNWTRRAEVARVAIENDREIGIVGLPQQRQFAFALLDAAETLRADEDAAEPHWTAAARAPAA
jgi:hypothetical protein